MAPKYILEHFMEAELLINITEHEVYVMPQYSEWPLSIAKRYDHKMAGIMVMRWVMRHAWTQKLHTATAYLL